MDILQTIQNRTRARKEYHYVEELLPSGDVIGRIMSFLDTRTLARAEAVCRSFQMAAQMVWKDWSLVPMEFLKFDGHHAGRMNKQDDPKLIVQKWQEARIHCEEQAAIVREYFFDRGGTEQDIHGFSRLPHLHRNVLLAKFVDRYDFFVQVALVRRKTSVCSRGLEETPRIGDVEIIFEGFLTPSFSTMEGAKYVRLLWNLEDVWRRKLRLRWKSAERYLQSFSHDCQAGPSFQDTFISGSEVPEVIISAVGGAGGKPRLVFVTGGLRASTDGGIVFMDRISEQHLMLTHHFGAVPKVSLTFRPDLNKTCLQSMELAYSGSPR